MFPILRKSSCVTVRSTIVPTVVTDYLILGFCVYRCEIEFTYCT